MSESWQSPYSGKNTLVEQEKNYRGPHYMHGATQKVGKREQQLIFLQKRWSDQEQELITVILE